MARRQYTDSYRPSVERVCPVCGTTFRTYAAWIAKGGGQTCSRSCARKARPRPSREEIFWAKVDRSGGPDACWEWQGARHRFGYGKFALAERNTTISASRMAWILTNGEIPDGLFVLHRCDNPPCCNPAHLFLGTARDNAADAVEKGRAPIEERNGQAKLSNADVAEIRRRLAAGEPRDAIAADYGVTPSNISYIKGRRSWKRVD